MKVHHVKAAKDYPQHGIKKGEMYYWFKHRNASKTICKTMPRASQLCTSGKLSTIYAAQEGIDDAITAIDESDLQGSISSMVDTLNSAAEEVRQVGEEYRESAQNIEDGFGHRTSQCDEIDEKAENCDQMADSIEDAASQLESIEVPEDLEDEPSEDAKQDVIDAFQEKKDDYDEAIQNGIEELKSIVEGIDWNM